MMTGQCVSSLFLLFVYSLVLAFFISFFICVFVVFFFSLPGFFFFSVSVRPSGQGAVQPRDKADARALAGRFSSPFLSRFLLHFFVFSLLSLFSVASSVSLRRNRGTKVCSLFLFTPPFPLVPQSL